MHIIVSCLVSLLLCLPSLEAVAASRSAHVAHVAPVFPSFDPTATYQIQLQHGWYHGKYSGAQLHWTADELIIDDATHDTEIHIARGAMRRIVGLSGPLPGTQWRKGLWWGSGIGAGSGLLLGLGALGIVSGLAESDCRNCPGTAKKFEIVGIGLASGAVCGGVIGLLLGTARHRRQKISINPMIAPTADATALGLGVSGRY